MLHFNIFKVLVEVVEHHGKNIDNGDKLIDLEIKKEYPSNDMKIVNPDKLATFTAKSRDKALVITFLKRCDNSRYGVPFVSLEKHYLVGTAQYPTDLPLTVSDILSYL